VKTWCGVLGWVVVAVVVSGVAVAADEISQVKDLERQTWEVYVKKDLAGLKKITAPDFMFSDGESTQNWADTEKGFASENITGYKLGEMQALRVTPEMVILTYAAEQMGTFDGKDISGRLAVASVWVKRSGKWLTVFVHEVPLPKKVAAVEEGTSKTAMKLKVDHAGVCGYQLESLQAVFTDVGLKAEYGGAHATGGTHNALLGFDDGSYIELIALQHPESASGEDAQQWTALKPDVARACFWATDEPDIQASVASLRQAGLEIADPKAGSRKKPDGSVLAWQTAAVDEGNGGNILPFLIQDKTPRSARIQPSTSVKGSDLRGIEVVVLGVKDLDASVALYRRAYGFAAPVTTTDSAFGAKMAYFSGSPVLLAAPLDGNSRMTAQLDKYVQGPIALLLGTKDFAGSKDRLKLSSETAWFGRKVAWFDANKLHGARLGVVE